MVSGANTANTAVPNDGAWAERTVSITASGASATVYIETSGNVSDTDDVVLMDKAYLMQGTSAPTAWASSRSVYNEYDGDAQVETNYLDIEDVPGDVPALLQVRAAENDAHTHFWCGARHGGRARDAGLYHQGEDFSGGSWTSQASGGASGGSEGFWDQAVGNTSTNPASPSVATRTITSPPQGRYRVLVRARVQVDSNPKYIGLGFSYGGITIDPSVAGDYQELTTIGTNYRIYDLGTVSVPPIRTPENQGTGDFQLRIALYGASPSDNSEDPTVDWALLLPVDFGFAYVSKTSAQDVVLVDSRSAPRGVWLLNTSNVVQQFPSNQWGSAPEAHPGGTRLYFATDNGNADIDDGWKVRVTYLPRYLHVG